MVLGMVTPILLRRAPAAYRTGNEFHASGSYFFGGKNALDAKRGMKRMTIASNNTKACDFMILYNNQI